MKDRIRLLMDESKMTQQDFAAKLSISPASLSSIFTGRTNPTNNHVMAVHRAFPEVSVNWLLFGEGDMLVDGGGALGDAASGGREVGDVHQEHPSAVLDADEQAFMAIPSRPRPFRDPSGRSDQPQYEKPAPAPARTVKEIRIFFSDGTYESFGPALK